MEKINQRKMESELQKALAIEFVRIYCKDNNLSIGKLKKERFYLTYNECIFAHPSSVKPDGLRNDMETLPNVTLVIKYENELLSIRQTEYTKKFLSAE